MTNSECDRYAARISRKHKQKASTTATATTKNCLKKNIKSGSKRFASALVEISPLLRRLTFQTDRFPQLFALSFCAFFQLFLRFLAFLIHFDVVSLIQHDDNMFFYLLSALPFDYKSESWIFWFSRWKTKIRNYILSIFISQYREKNRTWTWACRAFISVCDFDQNCYSPVSRSITTFVIVDSHSFTNWRHSFRLLVFRQPIKANAGTYSQFPSNWNKFTNWRKLFGLFFFIVFKCERYANCLSILSSEAVNISTVISHVPNSFLTNFMILESLIRNDLNFVFLGRTFLSIVKSINKCIWRTIIFNFDLFTALQFTFAFVYRRGDRFAYPLHKFSECPTVKLS